MALKCFPHKHLKLERLALLPTGKSLPDSEFRSKIEKIPDKEHQQFLAMIIRQGLQFFWLDILGNFPDLSFSSNSRSELKDACLKCTVGYMLQKKILIEVDRLFENDQIPYAVFKGAHIREVVYENPAFRPSDDIDILISPGEKFRAIRCLCTNGYTLQPKRANLTHEVTLVKNNVFLDLHWHIMRPGRTRIELTELFLQSRMRHDFFWSPDNDLSLLIMLVHPVFTKYSTGPQYSMVRLVDLQRWILKKEIDWQRLLQLLQDAGLKTAAWITATLLDDLTECCLPGFFCENLQPKNPKRVLLGYWLNMNLSMKLANYPVFSKYIFTLMAHDNVIDIITFIRRYRQERLNEAETLRNLQHQCRKI